MQPHLDYGVVKRKDMAHEQPRHNSAKENDAKDYPLFVVQKVKAAGNSIAIVIIIFPIFVVCLS